MQTHNHAFNTSPLVLLLLSALFCGCASTPPQESAPINHNSKHNQELGPYENIEHGNNTATVVAFDNYNDPLEKINRPIFTFNHYTYRYFLTPVSQGYLKVVPKPVDKSVGNFFLNLREPLYAINNFFQFKIGDSGSSLLRFGINSTIGLLGLFDPASAWGIDRKKVTFSDTLAHYGAGYGAYLVLPLLGPSDLRDTASITFEYFAHPLNAIHDEEAAQALLITDGFHKRTGELARYPNVINESDDPYIFMRNLYLQGIQRDTQALRNTSDEKNTPSSKPSKTDIDDKIEAMQ